MKKVRESSETSSLEKIHDDEYDHSMQKSMSRSISLKKKQHSDES